MQRPDDPQAHREHCGSGTEPSVNVSVFGLGYVGCVSAACFARAGHHVVGVDVADAKVALVNAGKSPIFEPGINEAIGETVRSGALRATVDAAEAVRGSDVSLICVGTPSLESGGIDRQFLWTVARQIGEALRGKSTFHVIAQRSTALPGTVEEVARIVGEVSGKELGRDFGVAANPEFLREGSAITDFLKPPYTVVGLTDDRTRTVLEQLYAGIDAEFVVVPVRVAEMMKYACNAFHAVKVSFANEIGNLCKEFGTDSHAVMRLFVKDTKLNIAPTYLMPGFAFGGSCLPKDVSALLAEAQGCHLATPLLRGVMDANDEQVAHALRRALAAKKRRIAVLGLSFKAGTDDLRNSPAVTLVEALLGKGYNVGIFDPDVDVERLLGANRRYIEHEIPHLAAIMHADPSALLGTAELIIVTKKTAVYRALVCAARPDQALLDLVHILDNATQTAASYDGLCW
ncbi:MAG: UDP-glucose dehydrogenase family protein [Gemmatimonadaceae bacterium]